MTGSSRPLEVAVGVVYDDRGRVLVNQRQRGKSFAGQWEFPGGKIETGETTDEALTRELHEELGITVERQRSLISISHRYDTVAVRLNVNEVLAYRGEPRGHEDQPLRWVEPGSLHRLDLLAANTAIVKAIVLPRTCLITDTQRFGVERTLERLAVHLRGERLLLIIREKVMDRETLGGFVDRAVALCRPHRSLVTVHADCDFEAYGRADGIHLSAARLARPSPAGGAGLTGASCHCEQEIRLARRRQADYLLVSPVNPTPSHPDSPPLGWPRFSELARQAATPVYALGGLKSTDQATAILHGAQGVAMLGAAWQQN